LPTTFAFNDRGGTGFTTPIDGGMFANALYVTR
jgi:hypothetical protein